MKIHWVAFESDEDNVSDTLVVLVVQRLWHLAVFEDVQVGDILEFIENLVQIRSYKALSICLTIILLLKIKSK